MTRGWGIGVLMAAAALEAGGDALIRVGLHRDALWERVGFFVLAGVVLFAYGWTVNAPGWDFGRLLGLYVVFFFVFAQLAAWFVFRQPPSGAILLGGGFIVLGGVILSLGQG